VEDPFVHIGPDGAPRCWWTRFAPEFISYHDEEWGYPVADDIRLFEKMSLESFQAGLSWRTILNKRGAFREAFDEFDFGKIATYGPGDVERLLSNADIVRHRGKIEATIHNAAVAIDLVERYGSLAAYAWRFEPGPDDRPERVTWASISEVGHTRASKALSKDLKQHGWRFFGPTTAYAFMQAMGLVNDHQEVCCCRSEAEAARAVFERPARRRGFAVRRM
jgi:DNA-3-methyladenine glycosylase I